MLKRLHIGSLETDTPELYLGTFGDLFHDNLPPRGFSDDIITKMPDSLPIIRLEMIFLK
jgi:hypothetical protein